ncbi:MAG: DUF3105 domain-containing protein [Patescibacteria group bacterium]
MDTDQNLTKKERKELKREMKAGEMEISLRRTRTKKIAIWVIGCVVVVAGAAGIFVVAKKQPQQGLSEDHSKEYANQGQDHIAVGDSHIEYNSNPPTSGPHYEQPVKDGVYNKAQPDEGLVHSLEHGRIWISYKSSISDTAKEQLRNLASHQVRVVLTLRDQNPTDIAVAAWQRLDTFNLNAEGSFDENRILDFIKRYKDKAPENGIAIPANMSGKEY